MTIFCPKCGLETTANEGDRFCMNCQADVSANVNIKLMRHRMRTAEPEPNVASRDAMVIAYNVLLLEYKRKHFFGGKETANIKIEEITSSDDEKSRDAASSPIIGPGAMVVAQKPRLEAITFLRQTTFTRSLQPMANIEGFMEYKSVGRASTVPTVPTVPTVRVLPPMQPLQPLPPAQPVYTGPLQQPVQPILPPLIPASSQLSPSPLLPALADDFNVFSPPLSPFDLHGAVTPASVSSLESLTLPPFSPLGSTIFPDLLTDNVLPPAALSNKPTTGERSASDEALHRASSPNLKKQLKAKRDEANKLAMHGSNYWQTRGRRPSAPKDSSPERPKRKVTFHNSPDLDAASTNAAEILTSLLTPVADGSIRPLVLN